MDEVLVTPLAGTAPDPLLLGGKGAGLAQLVELGHPVPPGLVVTTQAFDLTLDYLGVIEAYRDLSQSIALGTPNYEHGELIAAALRGGRLPDFLRSSIAEEVERLRLWEITSDGLIVRSSATVEDSAEFSFAGIFESFQVGEPEQLEATIMEVWSSAFARRAISYSTESGVGQAPKMAMVLQVFLEATRSGVMFTTFGGDRTLVEHVEGGCEKLVKGEVIPARFWMARTNGEPEGDTVTLTAAHTRRLAELANNLESRFGGPQDVEWCVYDDAVHVLQTRPITAGLDQPTAGDTSGAILTGVSASRGIGAGSVHLVFNIDQALALEAGQVLVTPMTNPDMVVAMRNSAAILTDVGGMICHAAIVSRELGLPCVVGTEHATNTLTEGEVVTVDGSRGAVYSGLVEIKDVADGLAAAEWTDVWDRWMDSHFDFDPVVSSVSSLATAPYGLERVVLRPEIDLRADLKGMWADLERMRDVDLRSLTARYLAKVTDAAAAAGVHRLEITTDRLGPALAETLSTLAGSELIVVGSPVNATPLGSALAPEDSSGDFRRRLPSMAEARDAALDTIKFFGHEPSARSAPMPDVERRREWWRLLPEYGRFHAEHETSEAKGDHDWLEVRPELVISALLKSLVQPGFEMVPRVLGFPNVAPLHIKWMQCRYRFRSDAFADVWAGVVRATWNSEYMADLMHRVRSSYDQLAEVLELFPQEDDAIAALRNDEIVALVTSWWPRWVEFFSLCWFIQAQGDDILYPFIEETVAANLNTVGRTHRDVVWPTAADLVLPTTPVLSGDYMASIARLREALLAGGLTTPPSAVSALASGSAPEIARLLEEHLVDWHWMRDRDLLFEPWDTPAKVIETALRTDSHIAVDYAENLRRNLFGLSLHCDLAETSGRADALNHAVRFLHDLNVERENHHVLWLKYSYPLRRIFLEVERRLIANDSIEPGDVWFLQAPELIATVRKLPKRMDPTLTSVVKNRRRGFEQEARLSTKDPSRVEAEDDYL